MPSDWGPTGLGTSAPATGTVGAAGSEAAPRAPRPPSRDDRPALRPTERRRHLSEPAHGARRRGAIRPATSALALVALGLVAGSSTPAPGSRRPPPSRRRPARSW